MTIFSRMDLVKSADDMVKAGPALAIKSITDNGEFEGYGSTFGGEPDAYGDVIAPGAYTESLKSGMPKMFWQHDPSRPIGKWTKAVEDDRGLFLQGKLNMDVQQAREAYALIKSGDIDGLSIGYRIREYSVDTDTGVWTLEKIDLREVSIVSIGANDNATITSVKAAKQLHQLTDRLKAGDRLTEREFEVWLKGLGFSNSQAERAARLHLKGQRDSAEAEKATAFMQALLRG
ncbi:HK97 family phage prohead protease [Rhizobium sp. CSW-27]|uniref:HK97 family phage prohead protease n=1 Tax=Rhizobium sp. CSW-27 TaxID=2839985 RepID=UPI001C0102D2|nr:HK97 family phage prohead protease [Rhizobium sp. CSW-27]MBT9370283.1 HK97 family phage prohead protease [Rhizobium sp. CSW-27]